MPDFRKWLKAVEAVVVEVVEVGAFVDPYGRPLYVLDGQGKETGMKDQREENGGRGEVEAFLSSAIPAIVLQASGGPAVEADVYGAGDATNG